MYVCIHTYIHTYTRAHTIIVDTERIFVLQTAEVGGQKSITKLSPSLPTYKQQKQYHIGNPKLFCSSYSSKLIFKSRIHGGLLS